MTADDPTDATAPPRAAPEGWVSQPHMHTFSGRAGPFYFREKGAEPGIGFFAEPYHANMGGVIHGGALMTLADMSLWDICRRRIGMFKAATVTLNAEFVSAGRVGQFVTATGEMTHAGKSLLFARGLVSADGETLLSFSGTLKRFD